MDEAPIHIVRKRKLFPVNPNGFRTLCGMPLPEVLAHTPFYEEATCQACKDAAARLAGK
jgi:hypothetical protein